jgi:Protein of unknown function (DUF3810)
MGVLRVKGKLSGRWGTLLLVTAALIASCTAFAGIVPAPLVEEWYSRGIFPRISAVMAPLTAAVPLSWIDLVLPAAALAVAWSVYRRRYRYLLGMLAGGYLFFFLAWGLNYQRMPLVSRLDYDPDRVTDDAVRNLRQETAAELNSLYPLKERVLADDAAILTEAGQRVEAVVSELDGIRLPVPTVKTSWLLNPIFQAGGTLGMYNPFGREALVVDPLLPFERPVIVMHEMAHVLGYANEGEANFIAFLAAIHSDQPISRYSGWLSLWRYLERRGNEDLLDAGPRRDLEELYERYRQDRVEWVSRAGDRTLDTFLRANRVRGGVFSYSEIVRLAVGTRPSWDRFAGLAADD